MRIYRNISIYAIYCTQSTRIKESEVDTCMIRINPYRPGAGMVPAYLAGRQDCIEEAVHVLEAVSVGFPSRSIVYYGLRGVGKTVLLNHLETVAEELPVVSEYMEITERGRSFQQYLALAVYKLIHQLSIKQQLAEQAKKVLSILKAFSLKYACGDVSVEITLDAAHGISDTGNLENDIMEVLISLGQAAKSSRQGVVLFIDEIQYMKEDELESLMTALHRLNQKGLPIVIMAAGLPKIAKIAGDVKSYAERLFQFVEIGTLTAEDAKKALTEPAAQFHVTYEPEALQYILDITEGYPYFLQEYGKWTWEARKKDTIITKADAVAAFGKFEASLDESFFKVRHDRATPRELAFMIAMVQCGERPCNTKDIASQMGESVQRISPLRAQLIHKGFIFAAKRGAVDFTVPHFDSYLKRMHLV